MKDILFKAKRIDNGKWVEGYYAYSGIVDRNFILTVRGTCALPPHNWIFDDIEIDKNTLCQYTGLTDKNGNRIWENDIVKKEFYTDYDMFANSEEYIGVVKYEDCAWCVSYERDGHKCNSPIFMAMEYHEAEHFNVIGNIFDNPELLEVGE